MSVDHGGLSRSEDPDHEAWQVALDRIELDLIRVEKACDGDDADLVLDPWSVPQGHGPMPASLRQRAEELLARQQTLVHLVGERLAATERHRSILETVGDRSSVTPESRPVYVDLTA